MKRCNEKKDDGTGEGERHTPEIIGEGFQGKTEFCYSGQGVDFIFKKIRDVNAEEVSRVMMNESKQQIESERKEEMKIQKDLIKKAGPTVKKIKSKLKIKSKTKIKIKNTESKEISNQEKTVQPAPGSESKKPKTSKHSQ